MEKNKKAETLVGFLVAAVILGIVVVGIVSIMSIQNFNTLNFETNVEQKILRKNIENIIQNMSFEDFGEENIFLSNQGDKFVLKKEEAGKSEQNYKFKTKTTNLENPSEQNNLQNRYEIILKKREKIEGVELSPEIIINNLNIK
ncbi:hypothetical protein BLD25_04805 [Candidatus Gracilibacteria bacterium GN02-872]|nr:hypothetical protein BLD25_04805 [Candidatus Gracilibacteria bacterium GN02-872]RKW23519.1 MAG: hypothetical protein D8B46_03245 [Candidatus Gracilibacteria bacterium]